MDIGGSLTLIAIGAILKYAVTREAWQGINIDTTGVILMIVGAVGLLLSLFLMASARSDRYPPPHELP
jgi:hypothetical protein